MMYKERATTTIPNGHIYDIKEVKNSQKITIISEGDFFTVFVSKGISIGNIKSVSIRGIQRNVYDKQKKRSSSFISVFANNPDHYIKEVSVKRNKDVIVEGNNLLKAKA